MREALLRSSTALPGFRLLSSETVPLTPQLAKRFKEMTPSPTERLLNESRVKHLRAKADVGLLCPFGWAYATLDGVDYRMNAQHSSNMLNQLANGQFPQDLKAHIDHYEVSDREGMAVLFRQFDDRKSSRSPLDVAGAYQGLYPELADIDRKVAKYSLECVTWFNAYVDGLAIQGGDDQYSRFSDVTLYEYLHWMATINPQRELKTSGLGAAMYGTYKAAKIPAEEFWRDVANGGIEFNDDAPASVLYTWLKGVYDGSLNITVKAQGYYQAGIHAWNAFRQGKTINHVKTDLVRGGYFRISE